MALKTHINNNGLSGELYITVITSTDSKYAGVTNFLVRGFESREKLYQHINGEISGNIIAFEREFSMPLVDMSLPKWPQMYEWLKMHVFQDASDC